MCQSIADHREWMERTLSFFPPDEAADLRRRWQAVLKRSDALVQAWERLPHGVQHGDLHAGNLSATDPPTLTDWEHAVCAPFGLELRSVLVMSGDVQFDRPRVDELIDLYGRTLRAEGVWITDRQVALGLWLTYFAWHALAEDAHPQNLAMTRLAVARAEEVVPL